MLPPLSATWCITLSSALDSPGSRCYTGTEVVSMKSINLRIPDELHERLTAVVQQRKRLNLGASLNTLILEACAAYLQQLEKQKDAPGE